MPGSPSTGPFLNLKSLVELRDSSEDIWHGTAKYELAMKITASTFQLLHASYQSMSFEDKVCLLRMVEKVALGLYFLERKFDRRSDHARIAPVFLGFFS